MLTLDEALGLLSLSTKLPAGGRVTIFIFLTF